MRQMGVAAQTRGRLVLVQTAVTTVIGDRLKSRPRKTAFSGIIKIVSRYLSMKCAVVVKCAENVVSRHAPQDYGVLATCHETPILWRPDVCLSGRWRKSWL